MTLPIIATLGTIAWYAWGMLPQRHYQPGFMQFFALFFGGLVLPYLIALVLLVRGDGRAGVRLAAATAAVNALWSLPLAVLLLTQGGYSLDNPEQLHSLLAVTGGALLQLMLMGNAARTLRHGRRLGPAGESGWAFAVLLPLALSGSSLFYLDWQLTHFKARALQAVNNGRQAQHTIEALQSCLNAKSEAGFPANLDGCPSEKAIVDADAAYRFEYLPALPDSNGRIAAYMLCATPKEFRASGFETMVADSTAKYRQTAAAEATLDHPPTCASMADIDKAIAWCAYAHAARNPAQGYPAKLADIALCLGTGRRIDVTTSDRIALGEETYAYVAGTPDEQQRITGFRIHRLGLAGGKATWIDETLRLPGRGVADSIEAILQSLPALAVPERFARDCEGGDARACVVAGDEWQRKARQTPGPGDDAIHSLMRGAAVNAFERGCELGQARACASLASEFESADERTRDVVRAAAIYEKACTAGDALACRRAAEMFENGRTSHVTTQQQSAAAGKPRPDLARDLPRAIRLYGEACDKRELEACFIAGRLLAGGDGVPASPDKALLYFARACSEGLAPACTRAAAIAPPEEKAFLRRACVLGEKSACR